MKEDDVTYRSEGLWFSWTLSSKTTHPCISASLLTHNYFIGHIIQICVPVKYPLLYDLVTSQ